MNIVMTGGTGFVGKHLTQALSQLGNQVVNIDRYDLNTGADSLVKLMSGADVVINSDDLRSNGSIGKAAGKRFSFSICRTGLGGCGNRLTQLWQANGFSFCKPGFQNLI